jgi:protein TonB
MSARIDILDQPERLRGPFVGSIALHAGMIAVFVGATLGHLFPGNVEHWGDPNGGRIGSVAVNAMPSVPLYKPPAPANPVANDTTSQVPQEVAKPKPKAQPKVKVPEPDAIPLPSRNAKSRPSEAASVPNTWERTHPHATNQLTSTVGQAVSSPLYNVPGGGGVGVGTNSPFGTQLGWYATLLRDQVARNWKTGDVDARLQSAPPVTITFTLLRDGSVPPGSVRVVQSSGNRALDFSTLRAVLDAGKFPPIPPQFTRDRADCELTFQLRR